MGKHTKQDVIDSLRRKGGKAIPTSSFGRLQKTARAAARIGAGALPGLLRGDAAARDALAPDAAVKMVEALGELKGVAMKVGQILSYADAGMSPEVRRLLSVLQVMSQPTAWPVIRQIVADDLGTAGRGLLARLAPEPVASASIGQVHRSLLDDGTEVAVKVRHPGIEEAIRADFRTAAVGSLFARLVAPGVNVEELLAEAEARFIEECDYALEARRQARFRELYAGHASITIPVVHPDVSGPRVLTSTWQEGMDLDSFLERAPYQAERVRAARSLYEFYVGTLYRHGLFNADPHPGNVLFAADGGVTILDHGCVREFGATVVRGLMRLSQAVRRDDTTEIQDALAAVGMTAPRVDFDSTRAILRGFYAPALVSGRHAVAPDQAISMRQVARLKSTLFKMRLPGKLLFLFRIRVGLYAVLARMGARLDWGELEDELIGA